jgi:transposase-like protein
MQWRRPIAVAFSACSAAPGRRQRRLWPFRRSPRRPHAFSASAISAINKALYGSLTAFAGRPFAESFHYFILDTRYEKVRKAGIVITQAVPIAVGIDWDGRLQIFAVEIANRESRSASKDCPL